MTNPSRSKSKQLPNFDRVVRIYRWAEYLCLGTALRSTREHFLQTAADAKCVLALGDGDGRFVAKLLSVSPHLQVVALDASAGMLRSLAKRCSFANDRLQTTEGDFVRLSSEIDLKRFDLIVSHFSLDCLSQDDLWHLARTIAKNARIGTMWLVSDFEIPPSEPWRTLGSLYVRTLYLVFRVLTGLRVQQLPDIHGTLEQLGFTPVRRHEQLWGLLYSEFWALSENLETKPTEEERATSTTLASSTRG